MYGEAGQCDICRKEQTSTYVELKPGMLIRVCSECMEKTRDNFIWLCTGCGTAYFRPREMVIERLENSGAENSAMMCEDIQLIQTIDMCLECDPQGIMDWMNSEDKGNGIEICTN